MEELIKELASKKDKYGNTYLYLYYSNSGVDNLKDANRIRHIARKDGYKAILNIACNLKIDFKRLYNNLNYKQYE